MQAKFKWVVLIAVVLGLCLPFLLAGHYESGVLKTKPHVDQLDWKAWYVTPVGTGDCSSWENACMLINSDTADVDNIELTLSYEAL